MNLYFRKSLKCRRKWPINCFSKAIRFPCWQINGTVVIAQKINFVIFLFFIINQWVWCISNLLVMSPKLSIFFGSSNTAFFEVLPLHLFRRDQRESLIYQLPFRKIKTQTCLLWEYIINIGSWKNKSKSCEKALTWPIYPSLINAFW